MATSTQRHHAAASHTRLQRALGGLLYVGLIVFAVFTVGVVFAAVLAIVPPALVLAERRRVPQRPRS